MHHFNTNYSSHNTANNSHVTDEDNHSGLYSHSLDSATLAQDWHQSIDDQLSSFLNLQSDSLHAHSLDSSFLHDAFDSTTLHNWNSLFAENDGYSMHPTTTASTNPPEQSPQPATPLEKVDQETQAILLSDPNFVWQQQLLQDQKAHMHLEERKEYTQGVTDPSRIAQSDMDMTSSQPSKRSIASDGDSMPLMERPDASPALSTVQKASRASGAAVKGLSKKEGGRRIQPGGMSSSRASRPAPISISGKSAEEIDHQRRFSELQQRFRINYSRKPTQKVQQQKPSSSTSASVLPVASSNTNNPKVTSEAHLGTSLPSSPVTTTFTSSSKQPHTDAERRRSVSTLGESTSHLSLASPGHHTATHPANAASATSSSAGKTVTTPRNVSAGGQPVSFPSRTMAIQIQRAHRAGGTLPFDAEERQRKLDEQLEKVDFNDVTVSELKELLRQRGKPATGKKAVLLQRLLEEKELIQAIRNGVAQRQYTTDMGSPQSFHASSPNMSVYGSSMPAPIPSPSLAHSSSSVPNTHGFPSSLSSAPPASPGASTIALNRSIANMHIGSPPISSQQLRRYSPYATPGSPRGGSSSKISSHYSSSVPTGFLSSSPVGDASAASGFQQRLSRGYNMRGNASGPGHTGRYKYAPFTSSALATPDHDEEENPFDRLIMEQTAMPHASSRAQDIPTSSRNDGMQDASTMFGHPFDIANADLSNLDLLTGFTQEELMALLTEQDGGEGMDVTMDTPPSNEGDKVNQPNDSQLGYGSIGFDSNHAVFGGHHGNASGGF